MTNNFKVISYLLILITGIITGAMLMMTYELMYPIEINYIAKDELLSLEKERTQKEDKEQNLFFGKTGDAVELASSIAHDLQSRRRKILFSSSSVYGAGVKSITSSVHRMIIDKLKN